MEIASDIRFAVDSDWNGDGCPPVNEFVCPACGVLEESADLAASILFWEYGARTFHVSNAKWAHAACLDTLKYEELIVGSDFFDADHETSWEE